MKVGTPTAKPRLHSPLTPAGEQRSVILSRSGQAQSQQMRAFQQVTRQQRAGRMVTRQQRAGQIWTQQQRG